MRYPVLLLITPNSFHLHDYEYSIGIGIKARLSLDNKQNNLFLANSPKVELFLRLSQAMKYQHDLIVNLRYRPFITSHAKNL